MKIEVGCCVMFAFYVILLAAAIHNTFRFVIRSYRYQNVHILYFYTLVYLIIITRVLWLSVIYQMVKNYSGEGRYSHQSRYKFIYGCDIVATYLELLMGIQ